jgi:hypothetical protein
MKRRLRILAAVVVLAAVGGGVYYIAFDHPDESADSWPELRAAATSAAPIEIIVGRNVHVSHSREAHRHAESTVAADPKDPKRLFAAAMLWRMGDDSSAVGYYSHDGGATWQVGFEADPKNVGERVCDESVGFGPDGRLYLAELRFRVDAATSDRLGHEGPGEVEFHRSTDGGKNWERSGVVRQYVDRPWLAVDWTDGLRRGHLYWCGQIGEPIFGASAGGAAWDKPITARPRLRGNHRPTQPVVLSDGAVVFATLLNPGGSGRPPAIHVFRSDDGGQSLPEVGHIPSQWRHPRLRPNAALGDYFPQLAVAGGNSRFRDRLYCVWIDGWTVDQKRVLLSASDDRGATWSPPVVVSEQSMDDPAGDYSVSMPTVAVNPAGVVAVCWYDCRAFAKSATVPGRGIRTTGYDIRLRVSLDGGESWGPSAKVNEQSAHEDVMAYGHTAGLTAAADGRFFPAWIDDRTGRPQLWCVPCTVHAVK